MIEMFISTLLTFAAVSDLGIAVIENKLAAYTNIYPCTSQYIWEGHCTEEIEHRLVIKTFASKKELVKVLKR